MFERARTQSGCFENGDWEMPRACQRTLEVREQLIMRRCTATSLANWPFRARVRLMMWSDYCKKETFAKRLDLGVGAVEQLVKRGLLPAPQAGGNTFFSETWSWP